MTKREANKVALAKMVDELGDLEKELEPYKPKFARIEQLRASLRGVYQKSDPARMYQATGERWLLLIGKAGNASVVDKAALLKLVGPGKFAEVASITLKALEEKCSKEILGSVVSLEPIGPRVITIVKAPAPDE